MGRIESSPVREGGGVESRAVIANRVNGHGRVAQVQQDALVDSWKGNHP